MTAALEDGEWSAARPGRTLPPEKNRYPFYRRLGGPQGRSGRAENFVPTGNFFSSTWLYLHYNVMDMSSSGLTECHTVMNEEAGMVHNKHTRRLTNERPT
jgi:hypothetical protein